MKTQMHDHLESLYKTQKVAAKEQKFDELYGNATSAALDAAYAQNPGKAPNQTVWSSMYLDTGKDLPIAASATQLAQQLHDIELYDDRSASQRAYLAQKAQVRYWMQQVANAGADGTNELIHGLYGRDDNNYDPYGLKQLTLSGARDYGYVAKEGEQSGIFGTEHYLRDHPEHRSDALFQNQTL